MKALSDEIHRGHWIKTTYLNDTYLYGWPYLLQNILIHILIILFNTVLSGIILERIGVPVANRLLLSLPVVIVLSVIPFWVLYKKAGTGLWGFRADVDKTESVTLFEDSFLFRRNTAIDRFIAVKGGSATFLSLLWRKESEIDMSKTFTVKFEGKINFDRVKLPGRSDKVVKRSVAIPMSGKVDLMINPDFVKLYARIKRGYKDEGELMEKLHEDVKFIIGQALNGASQKITLEDLFNDNSEYNKKARKIFNKRLELRQGRPNSKQAHALLKCFTLTSSLEVAEPEETESMEKSNEGAYDEDTKNEANRRNAAAYIELAKANGDKDMTMKAAMNLVLLTSRAKTHNVNEETGTRHVTKSFDLSPELIAAIPSFLGAIKGGNNPATTGLTDDHVSKLITLLEEVSTETEGGNS